jgi:hypothetical protein
MLAGIGGLLTPEFPATSPSPVGAGRNGGTDGTSASGTSGTLARTVNRLPGCPVRGAAGAAGCGAHLGPDGQRRRDGPGRGSVSARGADLRRTDRRDDHREQGFTLGDGTPDWWSASRSTPTRRVGCSTARSSRTWRKRSATRWRRRWPGSGTRQSADARTPAALDVDRFPADGNNRTALLSAQWLRGGTVARFRWSGGTGRATVPASPPPCARRTAPRYPANGYGGDHETVAGARAAVPSPRVCRGTPPRPR